VGYQLLVAFMSVPTRLVIGIWDSQRSGGVEGSREREKRGVKFRPGYDMFCFHCHSITDWLMLSRWHRCSQEFGIVKMIALRRGLVSS